MRLIDAENFEAFDSTLPIQIAPKGMRARKIASFFYAEGCKRVLESIDAASTIDPDSLRTTAKREKSFYESREKGKFIVCTRCRHAFSKKGLWCRKYRPECGARMEDPDHV